MRKLTIAIHEGSGVHMKMYADITLWTKKEKKEKKKESVTTAQNSRQLFSLKTF